MCLSCGCWPFDHIVHVADAPTRDEYIFLDENHSFYPDHRKVSEAPRFPVFFPPAHPVPNTIHSKSLNISTISLPAHVLHLQSRLPTTISCLRHDAHLLHIRRAQSFSPQSPQHGILGGLERLASHLQVHSSLRWLSGLSSTCSSLPISIDKASDVLLRAQCK